MEKLNLIMFAPLPSLEGRVRLAKLLPQLLNQFDTIDFYGWKRDSRDGNKQRNHNPRVNSTMILKGGGWANVRTRFLYLIWIFLVFWNTIKLGRNRIIFAVGCETAFPSVLAAKFTGSKIIFDDPDRISLFLNLPAPLLLLIKKIEKWTSYKAALHIVPGAERYEWWHERMYLLKKHAGPARCGFSDVARTTGTGRSSDNFR